MDSAKFLSKASVFSGDCSCDLHNRENEPARCLHYHDFYEFFVYLGRTGLFVIDGKEYPVSRGDIVIVNMFTPHMMIPDGERQDECFVAHINPELLIAYGTSKSNLLDIFQKSENFTPVYSLGKEAFAKYLNLMNEYRTVHLKNGHDILDKAIIHLLLAYAYSDFFSGIRCDDTVSHNLTVVTQIINYINEHLTEKISLPMLVKEVHYSKSYICRLFKQTTNKTISGYIQEKRIEMAACLLMRSTNINKVAEQSGFNNYSYFYKIFIRQMGCSPTEYRKRLEKKKSDRPLPSTKSVEISTETAC